MITNSIVQSIILGIVQGLTEFLPISSSAHLLVLPWLVGWVPMGLTFDVMVHGGTLLALIVYFREDLKSFIKVILKYLVRKPQEPVQGSGVALAIAVGTVPAIVFGGLFHEMIERELRVPVVTTVTLTGFGVLLWWAGRTGPGSRDWAGLGWSDGLMIGIAQALALVPGVSRSGITITAALLLGFSRVDSARFSFLLSIPIIGLTTAAKVFQLFQEGPTGSGTVTLFLGVLCSFLSGFLCIKYFLRFLVGHSFLLFALYRVALAALIYWVLLRPA